MTDNFGSGIEVRRKVLNLGEGQVYRAYPPGIANPGTPDVRTVINYITGRQGLHSVNSSHNCCPSKISSSILVEVEFAFTGETPVYVIPTCGRLQFFGAGLVESKFIEDRLSFHRLTRGDKPFHRQIVLCATRYEKVLRPIMAMSSEEIL